MKNKTLSTIHHQHFARVAKDHSLLLQRFVETVVRYQAQNYSLVSSILADVVNLEYNALLEVEMVSFHKSVVDFVYYSCKEIELKINQLHK